MIRLGLNSDNSKKPSVQIQNENNSLSTPEGTVEKQIISKYDHCQQLKQSYDSHMDGIDLKYFKESIKLIISNKEKPLSRE